ncbi:helix-turn-helix domain-containing protein [Serinibacter arcticus]|nr:helix-turn-helix domain-containing protein [Serinibacter arcticus]
MSTARFVITGVTLQGVSVAEVARRHGVHRSWIYKLLARYAAEGEAAFEPRSRRPRSSPNPTPPQTVMVLRELRARLVAAGLDAGAETLAWH